jgi:muconolactone delta-isomerase
VHFYRNVFSQVPKGKVAEVARMLKAIHAQEDRRSAEDGSATYFSHFLWRWLGRFSSRCLFRKRVEQRFHCEIAPLAPLRTRDVSQSRCDQHQS